MAKKKTKPNPTAGRRPAQAASPTAPSKAATAAHGWLSPRGIRETIEAFAVAFVLAFLFRSFDAEAFVIPTGSMATTLMGEHKDVLCPQCGYRYQAGASSESEDLAAQRGHQGPVPEVVSATCPMCRYMASVDPRTAEGRENPTYGGDRILVTKFTYEFTDPKRWQVVVFKYPLEAQTNYIKRLVGLPRESLMIFHGDVHVKPEGATEFAIERRPGDKTRVMAPIVYDNDYVVDAMTEKGWPLRWQEHSAAASDAGGWQSPDKGRSFEIDGSSTEDRWLGYRHFVPTLDDWRLLDEGPLPARYRPRAQLITDFVAYDTSLSRGQSPLQPMLVGMHWVGDLLLECELQAKADQGTALVELVRAGRHFRCQFDCATGDARLSIDGVDDFKPQAKTSFRGRGSHRVVLANVDRELLLWVDGSPVAFDAATTYEQTPEDDYPRSTSDEPGDLEPARIGSRGSRWRCGTSDSCATCITSPSATAPRSSTTSPARRCIGSATTIWCVSGRRPRPGIRRIGRARSTTGGRLFSSWPTSNTSCWATTAR